MNTSKDHTLTRKPAKNQEKAASSMGIVPHV